MSAIEDDLARIEEGVFKIQKEWERFFSGQERKAPFEAKQRLDRLIRGYIGVEIRNNIERFRFQSLAARYNTLSDLWNRRLRAMEEGRPLPSIQLKQGRASADAAEAPPSSREQELTITETRSFSRPEVRLSTLREDDAGVRSLYERFKNAREAAGEPEVRFESFKKLISQQRARLLDEKDAVAVDFRISVQDGKVALKAKPVRGD